jgi:DNA repair exonuclease SbcCD ATPase subunit
LAALRQKIQSGSNTESIENRLAELNTQHQQTLVNLEQKEVLLQEKEAELEKLGKEKSSTDVLQTIVAEKDRLLESKENEIKELQDNWQNERAELIKPALEGVSSQLEQLKRTVSKSGYPSAAELENVIHAKVELAFCRTKMHNGGWKTKKMNFLSYDQS